MRGEGELTHPAHHAVEPPAAVGHLSTRRPLTGQPKVLVVRSHAVLGTESLHPPPALPSTLVQQPREEGLDRIGGEVSRLWIKAGLW